MSGTSSPGQEPCPSCETSGYTYCPDDPDQDGLQCGACQGTGFIPRCTDCGALLWPDDGNWACPRCDEHVLPPLPTPWNPEQGVSSG